jgi:hypothetical protein
LLRSLASTLTAPVLLMVVSQTVTVVFVRCRTIPEDDARNLIIT